MFDTPRLQCLSSALKNPSGFAHLDLHMPIIYAIELDTKKLIHKYLRSGYAKSQLRCRRAEYAKAQPKCPKPGYTKAQRKSLKDI
jgi:hypothetical protein